MAYLFAPATTDGIDCGTGVAHAATFSAFVRVKLRAVDQTTRRLLEFRQPTSPYHAQCLIECNAGFDNQLLFSFSSGGGAAYRDCPWNSGWTAGSIHTVVVTYDGTTMRLYADTDATPKASNTVTATPDQEGTQTFHIGNVPAIAASADATIYEVGWWPGVVLSGAQAAAMGAGTPPPTPPSHYWPLLTNATDLFGGQHGTVTGATVVAHSGTNLYAATGALPAYTFNTTTDIIRCGTSVATAATFTAAIRYKPASISETIRRLIEFRQPASPFNAQCVIEIGAPGAQNAVLFDFSNGGTYDLCAWAAADLSTALVHTLVATYDGATMKIYAGTDATPKATLARAVTPDTTGAEFMIGGLITIGDAADGVIYEVAWWPSVVLTGAQSATLGGGGPMPSGFPLPAHYWPFVVDASDFYGTADGVVTGTTSGAEVGTSWFPTSVVGSPALLLLQRSGGGRGD